MIIPVTVSFAGIKIIIYAHYIASETLLFSIVAISNDIIAIYDIVRLICWSIYLFLCQSFAPSIDSYYCEGFNID